MLQNSNNMIGIKAPSHSALPGFFFFDSHRSHSWLKHVQFMSVKMEAGPELFLLVGYICCCGQLEF